jgi:transposase
MLRGQVGRGAFPPSARVDAVSTATSQPQDRGLTGSSWTLDQMADVVSQLQGESISRSTVWRILDEADLKVHKSIYWLTSHDPDFEERARAICQLYGRAWELFQQEELLICTDEKTGMQILERKHPTLPPRPGQRTRIEHEYIRHGTRALIGSFVVPTGQVIGDVGPTRTAQDFAAHLRRVAHELPSMKRYHWIMDNLNTHWSLPVCEAIAHLSGLEFDPKPLKRGDARKAFLTDPEHKHVFHFTPKHGSWLNQVELWFSVLSRRFLKRAEFASPEEFEARLRAYLEDYNSHYKHPYRWTYQGTPLVRGTPFDRTRRQQLQGRACFGARPKPFQRLFYPPRPYKRRTAEAALALTS